MTPFSGNGSYCYSDSLRMCLRSAGCDADVTSGLIEYLGGMAFGAGMYCFGDHPMFLPSSPANEPDAAISRALSVLGWTCDETRGADGAFTTDDPEEALARLRRSPLPAQVGPCNMRWLTYAPNHADIGDTDHYVAVLSVDADQVRVHDPAGSPYATVPLADFLRAWSSEGINYGPYARSLRYVLRARFRRTEPVSRAEYLRRGWSYACQLLQMAMDGPEVFSGSAAYRKAAVDVCRAGDTMRGTLIWFSLPLGARRCADAADLLAELGETGAAALLESKATVYGTALYPAVHRQWDALAVCFEQLAAVEDQLVALARREVSASPVTNR